LIPVAVFGPVDCLAFRRFASIFLAEPVRFPWAPPVPLAGSLVSCPLLLASGGLAADGFSMFELRLRIDFFLIIFHGPPVSALVERLSIELTARLNASSGRR
jgi:hypothetical protein